MIVIQLSIIVLALIGLAVLRFGLPILGMWLICRGCCRLQRFKI